MFVLISLCFLMHCFDFYINAPILVFRESRILARISRTSWTIPIFWPGLIINLKLYYFNYHLYYQNHICIQSIFFLKKNTNSLHQEKPNEIWIHLSEHIDDPVMIQMNQLSEVCCLIEFSSVVFQWRWVYTFWPCFK